MSTTTPRLGLIMPDGPDVVSRVSHLNGNWTIIDSLTGGINCTSTTRPSTPYAGQMIYETDSKMFVIRNAANNAWTYIGNVSIVNSTADVTAPVNGQMVFSLSTFSMFRYKSSTTSWARYPDDNVYQNAQTVNGNTTSTSYTTTLTGGTACGVAFKAPPSGKVIINNTTHIATTAGAGFYALCTPRVCTGAVVGSGTAILTAQDANACQANNDGGSSYARRTLITGLTYDNDYNVQQWFKVIGATTGTFGQKEIMVEMV